MNCFLNDAIRKSNNQIMNKILVNIKSYKKYVELHNTNKLDDKTIIYTNGGFPKFMNISEEIFEGRECNYEIVTKDSEKLLIQFKSKSLTDYRFDIFKEPDTNIWHLAFSLWSNNFNG